MSFEVHLNQDCANAIGVGKVVTVATLTVNNGLLSVGAYHVPLSNVLLIKEV